GDDDHQGPGMEPQPPPRPRAVAGDRAAVVPDHRTQVGGPDQVEDELEGEDVPAAPSDMHRRDGEAERQPDPEAAVDPAGPDAASFRLVRRVDPIGSLPHVALLGGRGRMARPTSRFRSPLDEIEGTVLMNCA